MALNYRLEIAAHATVDEIARELSRLMSAMSPADAGSTAQALRNDSITTESGILVRTGESHPAPWDPVVTDLGINPTVWVSFRLSKVDDLQLQQDEMIRLVSRLLNVVEGDAVLTFEGEVILLVRKDHVLDLNERDDLWPPHRLRLVEQPYRRASLLFADQ